MSAMFYRKEVPKRKVIPQYGFDKKTADEVRAITSRLSAQSTYNRRLSANEPTYLNNYNLSRENSATRYRTPSACGKRSNLSTDNPSRQSSAGKRLSERDMQRLIRRLQRPTESYVVSTTTDHAEEYHVTVKNGKVIQLEPPSEESNKIVRRIRRPTTASRAKDISDCHLCHDHTHKKETDPPDAFDYEYDATKFVAPEELDYIVSRMRVPTCSSAHGQRTCAKTPITLDEVKIRETLPLVSGLGRSRNYKEITKRLFPKPRYRMLPDATPITVYC